MDPSGGIVLVADDDTVAASWSYGHLIDLWSRKHNKAVFVSYEKRDAIGGLHEFRFLPVVQIGRGTDVLLAIRSLICGAMYYDPGSRIRHDTGGKSAQKKRNQFRIRHKDLPECYYEFAEIDLSKREE